MNKYWGYMVGSEAADAIKSAAGTACLHDTPTYPSPKSNRMSFANLGETIGIIDWFQGKITFSGDIDDCTRQLNDLASLHAGDVISDKDTEITEVRIFLAKLISILNNKQLEEPCVNEVLEYLHDHEFFENKIRGG